MTAQNQTAHPVTLYKLNYLAALAVSGEDAISFLQGQLTCNINDLTESQASIAAFCNPKGRVISTLLIVKTDSGFALILPSSLLDNVIQKLRRYILRSKVILTQQDDYSLLGLSGTNHLNNMSLSEQDFSCSNIEGLLCIKLPASNARYLCIAKSQCSNHSYLNDLSIGNQDEWRYQDISSAFPWFDASRSEQFIPQILNIDKLGGISFSKGCYTGQEIIARTHYLGKPKRQLFLAECQRHFLTDADLAVKDADSEEKLGDILALQANDQSTRLLIILQTVDDATKNLILDDSEHTPITLIPFQ